MMYWATSPTKGTPEASRWAMTRSTWAISGATSSKTTVVLFSEADNLVYPARGPGNAEAGGDADEVKAEPVDYRDPRVLSLGFMALCKAPNIAVCQQSLPIKGQAC
jgi:hypothetical protein